MPQVEYEDIISGEGALNKDLNDKEGGKTGIKFYVGDVLYGKLRPYLMNWLYPQFNGVAVGDFWVLRATECDSSFLYRLVQTDGFQRLANVSSGSKMPRADWNLISQSFFAVPANHAEQKAIAKSLAELDSLITLHQRKCQYRGLYGYLSWEQRKLGELCELNPTAVLPDSFEYVDLESVAGTDMISHRREEKLTAPSRAQRLASFGDIFYQTVRPYQKNNYFYELPDEDYVFSTGYAQLRPLCDGRFLFSSLQRDQFVSCVLEHCTGTSYPAINANDLAALFLAVPIDAEEQRLVGSILKPIDSLITLHQ